MLDSSVQSSFECTWYWRGPKSRLGPPKNCAPLRRHSASGTQNQGPECFHWYLAHGSRFCKIQQLQVAFAIKCSSLNPATFPYPRLHPFPYQDHTIAPPSRPIPQLRHLAAANLICWAAPLVVYIPLWTSPSFSLSYLSIPNPPPFFIPLLFILPVFQTTPSRCLAFLPFTSSLPPEPPLVLSWGKKVLLLSGSYDFGAKIPIQLSVRPDCYPARFCRYQGFVYSLSYACYLYPSLTAS